ncbi:MAG: Shikimate kinase I (EC [uncultured Sulfurovum sp.]|uniref:Shikimate kinase n=1 Tax=uncultured Sulfurovum sp. TaxID=269237 RepID=A0A6S6SNM4_9BACT|nr:MAG: Shikimate kinase I (EC [uncultured Sulfurovum sp.]
MVYDNVVLIGFMGSGKTSVGRILARELFKDFKDVDTIIEERENASVTEIFEKKGEAYFRDLEQKCINELTEKKGQIIATGGGLPIFSSLSEKSLIIYMDADFDVILKRLSKREREKRPLLADETRARALFEERKDTYKELAAFSVDANQRIVVFIHVIRDYILDQRVL